VSRIALQESQTEAAMFEVDWHQLFVPSGSLAEIVLRGTVIYLVIFAVMRVLPRREVGGISASDILVIVLIADAVQEGMAGRYESITEGLLLAATIFSWATAIDWIDYRFPQLRLAEAGPLPVVVDGRLLRRNMKREKVTEDEVLAQLRQHGYLHLAEVKAAYIEGDGHFSVIGREREKHAPPARRRGGG
jgi:uncharacterized membrane protein YcaP (DUF421 family)